MSPAPRRDPGRVYRRTPQGDLRLWSVTPPAAGGGEQPPRPGVVWFHGGGWNRGCPQQWLGYANAVAAAGYVCLLVEYRLSEKHHTGPIDAAHDAAAAMVYARRHAAALGLDPRRLVAAGGSAGGQLAALCGTMAPHNPLGLDAATLADARPDGLILFNPVFDNSPAGYGAERFGTRWQEFSPLHHLDARTPASLVLLGDDDVYLPVATARAWQEGLRRAGVYCQMEVYPGRRHGFYLPDHPDGDPTLFGTVRDRVLGFLDDLPNLFTRPRGVSAIVGSSLISADPGDDVCRATPPHRDPDA